MNQRNELPLWFKKLQSKAQELEQEIGWPDARQEKWRRTDLKRLELEKRYKESPNNKYPKFESNKKRISLSKTEVSQVDLSEAIFNDLPGVRDLYEYQLSSADNRFIYRLLSEYPTGNYIFIPSKYSSDNLIQLNDTIKGTETFTFNLVVLEEGSSAEIWESIASQSVLLHNRATVILLNRDSKLNYYKTQNLSTDSSMLDFSRVILKKGAEFNGYQVEKDIHFNKSHISTELQESNSHAEIHGIYHMTDNNFCEIFTLQDHQAPRCSSRSLYRGVLYDKSHSVYNGMIHVDKEATKTDAYLTNNNLLMNDGCRADSIPGLKIDTNDVKCSHGSTTGKLDKNQLFYLQSRGFSQIEAKQILTQAFLEEVIGDLPDLIIQDIESKMNWSKVVMNV